MIEEKQNIIDFLLEADREVTIADIAQGCQMQNKVAEKYITILVLSGLIKMKRQIGMPDRFELR